MLYIMHHTWLRAGIPLFCTTSMLFGFGIAMIKETGPVCRVALVVGCTGLAILWAAEFLVFAAMGS